MPIDQQAMDRLFLSARSQNAWQDREVPDSKLEELYNLLKMGPTSANSSPARFMFLRTREAKERLVPALSPGNVEKALTAPVTVIVAYDPRFYEYLPRLFPHTDARPWFTGEGKEKFASVTAFRNSSLQGAYLIMAARAVGLDCGPMSGFDNEKVDAVFLTERGWRSNFLVNLGFGDPAALYPRLPRLSFDEACILQ